MPSFIIILNSNYGSTLQPLLIINLKLSTYLIRVTIRWTDPMEYRNVTVVVATRYPTPHYSILRVRYEVAVLLSLGVKFSRLLVIII